MSMKHIFCRMLCLLPCAAMGQGGSGKVAPVYPRDYFRNPLNIPIFLAGNFGECRPGHFHSGVDIKTLGKENEPVYAAADGYISRIKMEKGGFGHAIYITHANGYTTLYAHLNDFAPAVQQYVHETQYGRRRWDVDLQCLPSQFAVKKGEQIAWSGNTGASTAPHLHFEIRDSKTEHPLNPELFGLPIIDKMPPVPAEVAVYDATQSTYEQDPVVVSLTKNGAGYGARAIAKNKPEKGRYMMGSSLAGDTLTVDADTLGIGINADDFMDGSESTITFLTADLYMDDSLQSQIRLDDIGYDQSRYINGYTDYKWKKEKGKWIQLFFKLYGNRLDQIYPYLNRMNGRLMATDHRAHKVRIALRDDGNNVTEAQFWVKSTGRRMMPVAPAKNAEHFGAGEDNVVRNPAVLFVIDQKQLYDDIEFVLDSTGDPSSLSSRYHLHKPYIPLHHYFDLQIKPRKPVPYALRNKVAMMYTDDKDVDGRAAMILDNGFAKAAVRSLGTYWLEIDTIPPVIKSLQKNGANLGKAKQITFEVKERATSVRSFTGSIDGKWVCFEAHADLIFYKFDEHCAKGKHELVFKVDDENGNAATYKLNFTR